MNWIPTLSKVRLAWRCLIVGLGGLHTSVAVLKQSVGADGINYLEIGEAFWRWDLEMAINGIWSPLYGIIAGGVLVLISPPTPWVFPTVQIVNFFIFLGSLACFEFFWSELRRNYVSRLEADAGPGVGPILWYSLGYALFLWSALNLIEIWSVTPDMLVSASVYLSAGFLLRVLRGGGWDSSIGMGISLGVGYLAKAPMFPLAIVCFTLALIVTRRGSAALYRLAPGLLAWALIAGPFMAVLSWEQGYPTFSEVSRFTYLKHVNRLPFPRFQPESDAELGAPSHPPALLHTSPDLYSYASPVRGTYPPSFDPDYFTEGLTPRISLREQLTALTFNLAFYFRLFFRLQGVILAVAVLTILLSVRNLRIQGLWGGDWYLTVWALACFAMYSLVFVTERYVGPFVVLFWGGILSFWHPDRSDETAKLSQVGGLVVVLALLTNVAALNLEGFVSVAGLNRPVEAPTSQFSDGPSASPPSVAEALRQAGVEAGTNIGLVGYGYTAFWAYLADVRIVAEVFPEDAQEFWQADEETKREVLNAFSASGALYVVAELPPKDPDAAEGWKPLADTGYWLLELPSQ